MKKEKGKTNTPKPKAIESSSFNRSDLLSDFSTCFTFCSTKLSLLSLSIKILNYVNAYIITRKFKIKQFELQKIICYNNTYEK